MHVSADRPAGVINPHATASVALTLKVLERAVINFPLKFAVLGSTEPPLEVAVGCIGEGAVVAVAPSQLDWGKISVLADSPRQVTLSNESLIRASFRCSVVPDEGVFRVDTPSGELAPGEALKLVVHTCIDDTIKFSAKLKIEYGDANPAQYVPLSATGVGSTVVATPSLESVVFGSQFSGRECVKRFELKNHSRRMQRLFFVLDAPPPNVSGHCKVMRGAAFKKMRTPACPNPPDPDRSVFGVFPEALVLAPGESSVVELRGLSSSVQPIGEMFLCERAFENNNRRETLFTSAVSADFINPVLDISQNLLSFELSVQHDVPLEMVAHPLKLTNISDLPVTATLNCPEPFFITGQTRLLLAPLQTETVTVKFSPTAIPSRNTYEQRRDLTITYAEHAQTDRIALQVHAYFPNIGFSEPTVAFGCIPNDTKVVKSLCLRNPGPLSASYEWAFIDTAPDDIAEIFDILPLRGSLAPGASHVAQFSYYGLPDRKFDTQALCIVTDGPTYKIGVSGEASSTRFSISKKLLDFGTILFDGSARQSVVLDNEGFVDLTFKIVNAPDYLVIAPMNGTITAKSKITIVVEFIPRVPQICRSSFRISISNGDREDVAVAGVATFPSVGIALPRSFVGEFAPKLDEASKSLPKAAQTSDALAAEVDRLALVSFVAKTQADSPLCSSLELFESGAAGALH